MSYWIFVDIKWNSLRRALQTNFPCCWIILHIKHNFRLQTFFSCRRKISNSFFFLAKSFTLNWNANLKTWVIYSILCAQLIPACKSCQELCIFCSGTCQFLSLLTCINWSFQETPTILRLAFHSRRVERKVFLRDRRVWLIYNFWGTSLFSFYFHGKTFWFCL